MPKQAASSIFMVRPKHFGYDQSTASSNAFQHAEGAQLVDEIAQKAITEFDQAIDKLRSAGIKVHVIEDTDSPEKPNAVFPNNWVSFHDEKVVLYPMLAENRRWERRMDIFDELEVEVEEFVDISSYENEEKYLESTGSMVLDYENKLAYACLSSRTNREVLDKFCEISGFEAIVFSAFDRSGLSVYHTNVLMCIGTGYSVICTEAIPEYQRQDIMKALKGTGHELITLTMDQMYAFAGNMLEVLDHSGSPVLVMSSTAMKSLSLDQKQKLSEFARLLSVEIPTIEKYGGGSVRCMMCRVN